MWEKTLNLLLSSIAFKLEISDVTLPSDRQACVCVFMSTYVCVLVWPEVDAKGLLEGMHSVLFLRQDLPPNLNLELPDFATQWVVGIWWQSTTSPWGFPSQSAVLRQQLALYQQPSHCWGSFSGRVICYEALTVLEFASRSGYPWNLLRFGGLSLRIKACVTMPGSSFFLWQLSK